MWTRRVLRRCPVVAVMLAVTSCGAGAQMHDHPEPKRGVAQKQIVKRVDGVAFAVQPGLRRVCSRVARVVGYAVPCPTVLPLGLRATPRVQGCRLGIIGPGGSGACAKSWRGWIVGSSELDGANAGPPGFQHLVVAGAPRAISDPARAIDGPAMLPGSRVLRRGRFRADPITGWFYYVPASTNIGSAFMGHLVMVWTSSHHTYAYGFHVVTTTAEARALDVEIARHLVFVRPKPTAPAG